MIEELECFHAVIAYNEVKEVLSKGEITPHDVSGVLSDCILYLGSLLTITSSLPWFDVRMSKLGRLFSTLNQNVTVQCHGAFRQQGR